MSKYKISIIGLGLIGGSLAKAFKQADPAVFISSYDKAPVLSAALKEKTIDEKLKSIKDAKDSDIIFLALPTDLSLEALSVLAPVVKEGAIITDVAGVKSVFEKKWFRLTSGGYYLGGHPMTGKEQGGFENSDPILFENAVYILMENDIQSEIYDYLLELIKSIGAKVKFINPSLHDEIVARVSHLPQLIATTLVNCAADDDASINYLDFAAGGFRDMTRIASSDFSVWQSVIRNNKEAIVKTFLKFLNDLTDTSNLVLKDDIESLKKLFDSAREKRDGIPKNTKGFINPLFDIFVYVKDEAGVLSKISNVLYQNSINIKDVEILKIREGTGGTMRFSFESKEIADKSAELIKGIGFKIK